MSEECDPCQCSGVPCPQGSGACCWFDFDLWTVECVDYQTQADCLTQFTNGYWHRDITCAEVPSCSGNVYPTDPPVTTTETPTTTESPTTTTTTTTTTTPSPDCCNWDGNSSFYVSGDCFFFKSAMWTENPENTWSLSTTTDCGDPVDSTITCDPLEDDLDLKWTLTNFDFPCANTPTATGTIEPGACDNPPTWVVTYDDLEDCKCCSFCCNWDGMGASFRFAPPCCINCYFESFDMTEIEDNVWEWDGDLGPCNGSCGDYLYLKISCDPELEGNDPDKWVVDEVNFPCIPNFIWTGDVLVSGSCDTPPTFEFDGDWEDTTCFCWDWEICTEDMQPGEGHPPGSNEPSC